MSRLTVRMATYNDLAEINRIYAVAREYMKTNGNPNQWKDNRPPVGKIYEDLEKKQSYVVLDDGRICGVFALVFGIDITYINIEDGAWLNDEPYVTIHRIAGDGSSRGIFEIALELADVKIDNIRIDTHADNKTMQHLLEKNGFVRCGKIYVDDGTERTAYQRIKGN